MLGLIVEVQRRPIFIGMGRVTALDVGQVVLASGTVSLRRYTHRPGEVLVLGDLVDRQVSIPASGVTGTLVDAAMEQDRSRDWYVTKLAVRQGRRRGTLHTYDINDVDGLNVSTSEQGVANLLAAFEKLRPADLAEVLRDLSAKRRDEVAAALDDDALADVLEELPEEDQV